MFKARIASAAVTSVVGIVLICAPVAMAQPADSAASTPKQIRKAQRKAARAKNNAELKELEKNGYRPGDNQEDYPRNIQNAARKSNAATSDRAKPASAP
jgi:hypothetical protein